MKLFHGTNNKNLELQPVKEGLGYHPGAGPVEFLGPSFSDSKEVALSYGKFLIEKDYTFNRVKKFRSLNALKNNIIKTFGLPLFKQNLGEYYRDIADSYKAKLLAEGYDCIMFPEGIKTSTEEKLANTMIPLSE